MIALVYGSWYLFLFLKSPAKSWSMYSKTRKVDPLKRLRLFGRETMISFSFIILG